MNATFSLLFLSDFTNQEGSGQKVKEFFSNYIFIDRWLNTFGIFFSPCFKFAVKKTSQYAFQENGFLSRRLE